MAIIKCPECGADISSQAKACPHCGYSVKPEEKAPSGNSVTEWARECLDQCKEANSQYLEQSSISLK